MSADSYTHPESCMCHDCLPGHDAGQSRSLSLVAGSATARPRAKKRDEWARGYFCALAKLLESNYAEGCSGPDADELFHGCRNWQGADPEDIEIMRRHGLLPNGRDEPRGANVKNL